jgi:hypothetical protein
VAVTPDRSSPEYPRLPSIARITPQDLPAAIDAIRRERGATVSAMGRAAAEREHLAKIDQLEFEIERLLTAAAAAVAARDLLLREWSA